MLTEAKQPIKKRNFLPKISISFIRRFLLIFIVLSGVFSSGYLLGIRNFKLDLTNYPNVHINRELPPDKQDLNFSLFWKVWDTLNAKYFDKEKLIPAQMVYGAISGMVSSINDPYTIFLPPKENKVVQEDLQGNSG